MRTERNIISVERKTKVWRHIKGLLKETSVKKKWHEDILTSNRLLWKDIGMEIDKQEDRLAWRDERRAWKGILVTERN